MYCPLKFNSNTISAHGETPTPDSCQCEKEKCHLWEYNTKTCALATDAILKGRQVLGGGKGF